MKVAINNDFGGFSLSDKAFEMLLDRKGIEWEKCEDKLSSYYYEKGHLNDDNFYICSYDKYEDRGDKDLISIIEELGEDSWGNYASLKIVEIPDDVKWEIKEYDGSEWIAEVHRTWR